MIEQNSGSEYQFYEVLGSSEGEISSADEDEAEEEEEEEATKRLLRLSSSGHLLHKKLHFELVAEGTIRKDMFESEYVYVFDVGHQIYTWIGREAGRKERRAGLQYAQDYAKDANKSPFIPICRVIQGAEDELFESSLEGWQGW